MELKKKLELFFHAIPSIGLENFNTYLTKIWTEDKEFLEEWIKVLRSNTYQQGSGSLFNNAMNTFCCLGVACSIKNIPNQALYGKCFPKELSLIHLKEIPHFLYNDEYKQFVSTLVDMNDSLHLQFSFNDIADILEFGKP